MLYRLTGRPDLNRGLGINQSINKDLWWGLLVLVFGVLTPAALAR
jgi:hypothetical protein